MRPCAISTHAPRTGSDPALHDVVDFLRQFQPTLPARGATFPVPLAPVIRVFQPTLPARGATRCNPYAPLIRQISTHAPRTGSDRRFIAFSRIIKYFNPRSPHGERHALSISDACIHHFNPRSPHGERQHYHLQGELFQYHFNPRSPHGERRQITLVAVCFTVFQPTLPARGATLYFLRIDSRLMHISTHAPRTGSDYIWQCGLYVGGISTHAPRTGSDHFVFGAGGQEGYDFNPRSPHGERL